MLIVAVCIHTPRLFLDSFTLWLHLIFKYSRCLSPLGNVCWAPPGSPGLALGATGLLRADSKMWKYFPPLKIQAYKFYFMFSDVVSDFCTLEILWAVFFKTDKLNCINSSYWMVSCFEGGVLPHKVTYRDSLCTALRWKEEMVII